MSKTIVGITAAALVAVGCAGPAAPLTAEQIPAAFVALATAADRTMHLEFEGTYAMGERAAETMPYSGTFDFAGEDFAGRLSSQQNFDTKGEPVSMTEVELAFVGGRSYQRYPGGNWEQSSNQSVTLDPLRRLTVGRLTYVGLENVDSRQLHHLRVADAESIVNTFLGPQGGPLGGGEVNFDAASSTFDVWVDAEAKPVTAELHLATGADPSAFGTISLTSSYDYSNWGAELYIVPPL